uniref:Uncharacterized protein n=1 Tax=Hyaloperonospora arabidopsidis (strain Emoy2) TaxID=559515 RepID=M4BFK5_HYAAE
MQEREICVGTPAFPSHGYCVWDAALLLADYLQSRCCELAAGVEWTRRHDACCAGGSSSAHGSGIRATPPGQERGREL